MNGRPRRHGRVRLFSFVEGPFLPIFTSLKRACNVQTVVFGFPFPTYEPTERPTDSSFRFRVSVSVCYLFGIGGGHGTARHPRPRLL